MHFCRLVAKVEFRFIGQPASNALLIHWLHTPNALPVHWSTAHSVLCTLSIGCAHRVPPVGHHSHSCLEDVSLLKHGCDPVPELVEEANTSPQLHGTSLMCDASAKKDASFSATCCESASSISCSVSAARHSHRETAPPSPYRHGLGGLQQTIFRLYIEEDRRADDVVEILARYFAFKARYHPSSHLDSSQRC